jgi:hypothetical protein
LNGNGNVICDLALIGFDVVLQHLIVNIDASIGGGLDDITGKGVSSAFKWMDGEGISVTDRTVYNLCVREEMS